MNTEALDHQTQEQVMGKRTAGERLRSAMSNIDPTVKDHATRVCTSLGRGMLVGAGLASVNTGGGLQFNAQGFVGAVSNPELAAKNALEVGTQQAKVQAIDSAKSVALDMIRQRIATSSQADVHRPAAA